MSADRGNGNAPIDRRAAIKKAAAGAAAAGVVWSAPKIEGLSLRPNYAAAASAGGGPQTVTFTYNPTNSGDNINVPLGNGNVTATGKFIFVSELHRLAYNGTGDAIVNALAGANALVSSAPALPFDLPSNTFTNVDSGGFTITVTCQ